MLTAPDLTTPEAATRRAGVSAATVLTWCGAIAFPVLMLLERELRRDGARDPVSVLVSVLALGAVVLLVRLLLQRPLVALALGLLGDIAMTVQGPTWELGYIHIVVVDIAVAYVVATRNRRTAVAATVMTLMAQIVLALLSPNTANAVSATIPFALLAMVTAWAIAQSIRGQRQHTQQLHAQATNQAVAAERLRIARELHDVISHSIGTIAIQAGMGSRVIDTQPAEARNALAAIEATSRETLAGLRRTLVALRRSDPDTDVAPGARLVDPTPGLAELDRLVGSFRDTGMTVAVRHEGQPRALPPEVDLAGFRIVQEAVTNVVRHAGTSDCRVTVSYDDAAVTILVEDDGRGGSVNGEGYGIVGMRERVELLRGELTVGAGPGGGFRVAARLPMPEPSQ